MADEVLVNKIATIERCLSRIREEHGGDSRRLTNETVLDSVVLNLQRACEASIDAAMHVAARRRLGVPQSSREAFDLLERASLLDSALADRMRRMVGFRNVAVHDYMKLNVAIVVAIVEERLSDFEDLCRALAIAAQTNR